MDEDEVLIYARTYPAAIAGTRSYFHFNFTNSEAKRIIDRSSDNIILIIIGEAVLVYQPDRNIHEPTELRVPVQWRYSSGLEVAVSPAGVASWNFKEPGEGMSQEEADSTLEIHLDQSWQGEELSVVITPAR